jgi:hypothetical protein
MCTQRLPRTAAHAHGSECPIVTRTSRPNKPSQVNVLCYLSPKKANYRAKANGCKPPAQVHQILGFRTRITQYEYQDHVNYQEPDSQCDYRDQHYPEMWRDKADLLHLLFALDFSSFFVLNVHAALRLGFGLAAWFFSAHALFPYRRPRRALWYLHFVLVVE